MLFLQTLKELERRNIPSKIPTTAYQQFSEPTALKKLVELSNITLKMYKTEEVGMNTEEDKIIQFPGSKGGMDQEDYEDKAKGKKKLKNGHSGSNLGKHPLFILATAVFIPVFLAVAGPYLAKKIGGIKLTESYIIPYTYAQEDYIANAPQGMSGSTEAFRESSGSANEYYDKACAVRSFLKLEKQPCLRLQTVH